MNTLAEIYNAIAGTFDSSAITANQNGSLIENLKYIESNLAWASGSSNIWNLNSGNVGIGTVNPEGILDVRASGSDGLVLFRSPDVAVDGGTNNSPILRLGGSRDGVAGFGLGAVSASFEFQTVMAGDARLTTAYNSMGTTTVLMTLLADGNLGIGAGAPEQKLEIAGNIFASISGNVDLTLRSTDSEDARFTFRSVGASDRLDILGSVSQAYFTILKGGNIGIGDTTPEALFEVSGGTASVSLFSAGFVVSNLIPNVTDTYDLGTSALRWRDLYLASGSLHIGVSGDEAVLDYNVDGDYLSFKPDGTNTRLVMLDAGNVGIGASAPEQKLEVAGNIFASISGNVDLTLRSTDSEDARFTFRSVGASDRLDILGSASQAYFTILKGGNVGIGTTAPGTLFEVAGGITTQTLFGAGLAACDGTGDKLAWSVSGLFSCTADQTGGGGGGGSAINIREIGYGATYNDLAVATLSFGGGGFALTASGTEDVTIHLDWTNGPASRTIAETITGVWTFSNGATVSSKLEVSGISSLSNAIWTSPTGVYAGNVGIGTREPLAKLNVFGATNSLRLSYDQENYGEFFVDSGGTLYIDSVRTTGPTFPYNVVLTTVNGADGGNVGIGEANPSTKFEVTGGAASISNTLFVEYGGNIGIGNTTPNAKLDVSGVVMSSTSAGDAEFILNAASIVGGKFTLQSGVEGSAAEKLQILNASDAILVQIASGGTIDILPAELSAPPNANLTFHGSQDGNNYVGLSTSTGQLRIQVEGTSDTYYLEIGRDSSVNDFAYLDSYWLNELTGGYAVRPLILNPSGGKVSIGTTTPIAALEVRPSASFAGPLFLVASNSNERFRITSDGNVGIGINAPVTKLDVWGDTNQQLRLTYSPTPTYYTNYSNDRIDFYGAGAAFTIRDAGSASMTFKSENVGIGTETPVAKLDIQGDNGAAGVLPGGAPLVLRVVGGTGGEGPISGTGGEGASMSFTGGTGGAAGILGGGGQGGSIVLTGGAGGVGGVFTGDGGHIILQPGSGGRSGGVGIGTAAPRETLEVKGNIFVAASGSSVVDYILSSERVGSPIPDDRFTITSSGSHNRVWLDTTGAGGSALSLATNGNERLALGQTSSNSHGLSIYNNEHFRIQTGNTSVTQKFILTTEGRIAVGTTATGSFYTIQGPDGATGTNGASALFVLRVTGGTGGAAQGAAGTGGEGASMSFTAGNGGAGGVVGAGGVGGHIRIFAGNGGNGGAFDGDGGSIALMPGSGLNGGGVGIGVLLPSNPLHVVASTGQVYPLRLETTGGGGIANYEGSTFRSSWSAGSTAAFSVLGQDGSNHRLTVLQTGLVGIGNSAPQTLVHIGSASATDGRTLIRLQDVNSTCNFTADAGSPTCGSDLRLKKDIENLSASALERLTALDVVTYRWKTEDSAAPLKTGFIAQNVQEYFPDLVATASWGDGEPALFLSQNGLIPYLVKAVQEQQEMIDALRTGFSSTESVLAEEDTSFFGRIIALFSSVLGIEFGRGNITVERLCVGSVCVTEEQFMQVFGSGAPAQTETPTPSVEPIPTPSPDASAEPTPEETIAPTPEPTPEPTPDSTPEPAPEPATEPAPEVQADPPPAEEGAL